MSTEDQNASLVQLMRDLGEARKQLVLTYEQLSSAARDFDSFSRALEKAANGSGLSARMAFFDLFDRTRVEQLKLRLEDAEGLPQKIEQIRRSLKAAGIDA